MSNVCLQCQHNNPDTTANCQICGAKVSAPCRNCGTTNPLTSHYCVECGVEQTPVVAKAPAITPELVVEKAPPLEPVNAPAVAEAPPPRPSAPTTNTPPPHMEPLEKLMPSLPGTHLQIVQAILRHLGTQERIELPIGKNLVFLGKPNDEIPPDIDVLRFAGSEIVSRVHALIHNVNDEAFYLEDAGSSNGTFLNDEPIKAGTRWRKRLQPGDTIALGKGSKVSFRFEIEE
jgi:ribosomal protein L40E